MADADAYPAAAPSKFDALVKNIGQADFWKTANALDTMIDFVLEIETPSKNSASRVAKAVSDRYNEIEEEGLDDYWYDDFGWWIVATDRLIKCEPFKAYWDQFKKIRDDSADRMEPATDVWKLPAFKDFQPAVPDGVWNGPERDPDAWGDKADVFKGIQNTVTNLLYLIAAQRLPSAKEAAANNEFKFLTTWFTMAPEERSLWWNLKQPFPAALVRERVSHFKNSKMAPWFQQHWVWTGDQGLILHALVDRYQQKADPDLLGRAKQILTGARIYLVDGNGALENWNDNRGNFSDYPTDGPKEHHDDYSTGKGVFWRNVLYAWNNNTDLRSFINQDVFKRFLTSSASSAMKASSNTIWDLTNDVAVLVAAAKIARPVIERG